MGVDSVNKNEIIDMIKYIINNVENIKIDNIERGCKIIYKEHIFKFYIGDYNKQYIKYLDIIHAISDDEYRELIEIVRIYKINKSIDMFNRIMLDIRKDKLDNLNDKD